MAVEKRKDKRGRTVWIVRRIINGKATFESFADGQAARIQDSAGSLGGSKNTAPLYSGFVPHTIFFGSISKPKVGADGIVHGSLFLDDSMSLIYRDYCKHPPFLPVFSFGDLLALVQVH